MSASKRRAVLGALARDLRSLVTGRETPLMARATLAEERWHIDRGRAALDQGDPDGARAEAETAARSRAGSAAAATLVTAAGRSRPIRGRGGARAFTSSTVEAAAAQLRAQGHAAPVLLAYHQASPDNPFQDLLYRRAWDHGLAPVPLWDAADIDRLPELVPAGMRAVLHLHWVNRVVGSSPDAAEAAVRAGAFAARLDGVRAAGIPIVWTAHNVLPHDTPYPAEDALVRKAIVERASLIHLLAAGTPELAAPWYEIPAERTVHVPLPSFKNAYPDVLTRAQARFALGLPGDAWVAVLIGGLRAHKGLNVLMDALDLAAEQEPRLHLVIAGSPVKSASTEAFLERARAHPRVSLHARMIPADDMQLFLRAADAAVLPYLVTLNSAVLMTALAFDLPVVVPPVGGIAETITPEVAATFQPDDPASLARAILAVRDLPADTVVAAARRISDSHDADRLSDRLMTAIAAASASGRVFGDPT